jgi:DNA primase
MTQSSVQTIKERLSIIDVISSYIKLEKSGTYLRGRCPFHNEKTPSFFVSPARGTYHCFGCNRGGDIFSFVEEIEACTFREALTILANKAGVTLEAYSGKSEDTHEELYKIHEEATKFFEARLANEKGAMVYLEERGLTKETIKNFRVGYALRTWDELTKFLLAKGFAEKDLIAGGVSILGKLGPIDRFRGRIMFPICDANGRVVGFSGRVYAPAGVSIPSDTAKYVNSPETPIYHKGKILFGYDKAKRAMLRENRCIVVEGQFDLLLAHQAKTEETVAVSGTALTEEHLRLLKRFTDNLLFSFDADQAGVKASGRSYEIALAMGMNVEMVILPKGKDPADLIREDVEKWKDTISKTKHIIDFLIEAISRKELSEREFRSEIGKSVIPYIASVKSAIDRAHFVKRVSDTLLLPEQVISDEVSKARSTLTEVSQAIKSEDKRSVISRKDAIKRKLIGFVLLRMAKGADSADSSVVIDKLEKMEGKSWNDIDSGLDSKDKEQLLFEAEMYYSDSGGGGQEVQELLNNLELEYESEALEKTLTKLRKAESLGNEEEINELMKLCKIHSSNIETIKSRQYK